MATYKITFSKSNWTDGTDAIWYDTVQQAFFGDENLTQEVTAITPPSRECWRFNGFYNSASGTVQYIDDAGNFTDALLSLNITAAKTFYAQGTQVSWKLTLDDNEGAGGDGALYFRIGDGGYFDNHLCEGEPVSSVSKPSREGYAFAGYHNGTTTPGTQYIDKDGGFTSSLDSLSLSNNKTIYARWVAPYKITVSANSGAGGTSAFYFDSVSGKFFSSATLSGEITSIMPHTRECYAFLGCYASNNTTSAQRVSADGTIASDWIPAGAVTIYAQWEQISHKITLNKSSGSDGTSALYYKISGGGYYADDLCTVSAQSVTPPVRSGYVFKGYYNNATTGTTQYIDRSGAFQSAFISLTPTSAKTIYAQWKAAYKITLNKSNGAGGTDAIWYSVDDDAFFADDACTVPAQGITPPVRECYRFNGFYNSASGTTQYINADGEYTAALDSLSITSAKTFYAQWTRVSYKATLDDNNGSGGSGAFYFDGQTANFYADDQLTVPTSAVAVPVRAGYDFLGYYASKTGGSRYVDEAGGIAVAVVLTGDLTIYARWSACEYTLTFNYNGGTPGTVSKTVTFGAPVGELPSPSHVGASFEGWYIGGYNLNGYIAGGTLITASTPWNIAGDAVAAASWLRSFGGVVDYFGLASSSLIPIGSDSGDNRERVCCAHMGRFSPGVNQSSGVWRNPSVDYLIVADMTVALTLGKAFAAEKVGGVMTVSGYMITSAQIATGLGRFPVLRVHGSANEGQDAINKFNISVPVVSRARSQNLLGALVYGGTFESVVLTASCDPVVVTENMMPCASDVVNGVLQVSAETVAAANESAPEASGGFALVGEVKVTHEGNYRRYSVIARKEIV